MFDSEVFEKWEGGNLERDVLPALADDRHVFIYQHNGFWRSMDTHKDQQELTPLWREYAPLYTPALHRPELDRAQGGP